MNAPKGLKLSELLVRVKEQVNVSFPEFIWVRAEISSLNVNYSGHCYMDLVELQEEGDEVVAKVRAVVWRSSWTIISSYFQHSTTKDLSEGMSVLLRVKVMFSEVYGISLVVKDIDPTFTVGDNELKKLAVIERLKKEGMFDMNTTIDLPVLPRNFAVISSETAAGYRDFMKHVEAGSQEYSLNFDFFSAPMQGNIAPEGIIRALDEVIAQISSGEKDFDAVLIMRGGGSVNDLSCFDDYNLATNVAQYPLPVMIAVGHDHDYHICDMVARVSVKTPTALADYILGIFNEQELKLSALKQRLSNTLRSRITGEAARILSLRQKMFIRIENNIASQKQKLNFYRQILENLNPRRVLEGGYALIFKEGVKQSSIEKIKEGDEIMLLTHKGELECIVKKIKGVANSLTIEE